MVSNDLKQMVLDYLQKNKGFNRLDVIAHNLKASRLDIDVAIHQLIQDGIEFEIVRRYEYVDTKVHDKTEFRLYAKLGNCDVCGMLSLQKAENKKRS